MTTQKFYLESAIADKIGIHRDELKRLRADHLEKKRGDWKKKRREVHLSEPGLQRILQALAESTGADPLLVADFEDCSSTEEKKAAVNGPIELTIKKLFPNPRLLLATLPDDADEVRVRVPSSENFRPKMKIKAKPVTETIYALVGRCPRWPGRW